MSTVTGMPKQKKAPKPTSDRKRPNKTFIKKMAAFRGYETCNEKTMLVGIEVKNALQRVNNRAFDESIKATDCAAIKKLMREFVKGVSQVLDK